jgi:hypothetical protein
MRQVVKPLYGLIQHPSKSTYQKRTKTNSLHSSEGLEGDGEMEVNEEADERGEWEDEQEEIAAG